MRQNKRKFAWLAGLAITGAVAGTLGVHSPAVAQESDKILVIARNIDLNSTDPHRCWADTCVISTMAMYAHLTVIGSDHKVAPELAESWESNGDNTEFTFKLAANAKFSDGSPVEAKDVKWSLERLKNLKSNASFLVDPIASIEAPDAATVVIKLTAPNSEFTQMLSSPPMAIINSDVASENGAVADATADQADKAEPWFNANSAGAGAFVLEKYEPESELRYKRNENYWKTPPHLAGVVIQHVKDAVAQAQALQTGAADIAQQIDPDTAKSLAGNTDVTVKMEPSFNFIYLALAPGAKANTVKLTPDVREAISLAVDRQGIIDITLGGGGRPMAVPIPFGYPGADGHEMPAYDPARAKELLAAAGHADGFTMKSIYPDVNNYGVDFNIMMQKVQQDLAKVGIKIELQPMPFANWREQANGDHIPLTAVFYSPDYFGTSLYVDYFGLSEGSVWANRAGADTDPSVINTGIKAVRDAALKAASPDEAAKLWFEAGEMIRKDRIILPVVSPDVVLAYRNTVKGVAYSICCDLPLADISLD